MDAFDPNGAKPLIDGRYRIVRRIARGGMSQVYIAHDQRLDRNVALKIMHPYLAESDEFVRLFRREARAAARLSHPGIVAVYDQGNTGDSFYLTMEYIAGGNLRQHLARHGALTVNEAFEITGQILAALGAAHRADLIHRDMKPENVLLPTTGGVKVVDFGLARAVTQASMAGTGTVLGTVAYLAPEVITHGGASPASDIYSVGIMLYELLTGQPPFAGETPIQVAMKHVSEEIPAISTTLGWMPREVDDLLAAFTARDSADRDPSAELALAHLQRVHDQLPTDVLTRRADVPAQADDHDIPTHQTGDEGDIGVDHEALMRESETAAMRLDRHATAQITHRATQALQHADSALVAVPVGAVRATPSHMRAPAKKKRRRWPAVLSVLLLVLILAGAGTWWWLTIGPGSLAQLPNVAGKTEAQATDMVRDANFAVQVTREYHDEVANGVVIRSDPAAGKIKKDSTVTLLVSKGIRTVTIPALAGRDAEEVLAALRDLDVAIGESIYEANDDVPEGNVISASQREGDVIPHNQAVILTISTGPAPITFPDLAGKSREEAEAVIGDLALAATWQEEFSDDVPAGNVISQQPGPGSEGHRKDAITVTVSKGPELFDVPDVFGKSAGEARRILEEAGFSVEVEKILGGVFGTVRSQDPGAGAQLPRGATVIITVV